MVERGEKKTHSVIKHTIYLAIYQKQQEWLKMEKFLLRNLKVLIELKLLQDPYLSNIKLTVVIFKLDSLISLFVF